MLNDLLFFSQGHSILKRPASSSRPRGLSDNRDLIAVSKHRAPPGNDCAAVYSPDQRHEASFRHSKVPEGQPDELSPIGAPLDVNR